MPLKLEPCGQVKEEGGQGGGFHPAQEIPSKTENTVECVDLCSSSSEEEDRPGRDKAVIDLTLCSSSMEGQQGDPEGGMDSGTAPEREPSPAPQPSPSDHQQLAEKMARYQEDAEACSLSGLGLNDVEEDLVGIVVRYMLFSNQEKPAIPVPRSKLSDAIFQDLVNRSKSTDVRGKNSIPKNVIPKAQFRMLSVFGIEMVALGRSAESSSKSGSAEHYVLRNALPAPLRRAFLHNVMSDRTPDPALATVVLAFIELSGGYVEEGELWEHLAQLGLEKDKYHPHFEAKPTQAMQKLESAKIITKKSDRRHAGPSGEVRTVYSRGECALDEADVNAFIGKVFDSARGRGHTMADPETHN
ncbi:MAGE family-domain-containing protein [Dunaliella salina]|uniref:MAGE family-domain-containing protein n=1 Tax=Dunaliella salina TaxID=3046 RepID=A0ABQ7GJI7_DUNSA|nr:MAGE family-domain-containing protein [Dunaliella salina]|eukprot:KAF5834772.1 MAGE family-domain-containing protein [Dunaliella salina]